MLSAKEHSPNLIPVLLYGGASGDASAAAHENILWYREQGGIVYHHNLTFMADLEVNKPAARHACPNIGQNSNRHLQCPHCSSKHACARASPLPGDKSYSQPTSHLCPTPQNDILYTTSTQSLDEKHPQLPPCAMTHLGSLCLLHSCILGQ